MTPTSDYNVTFHTLITFFRSTVIKYDKSMNRSIWMIDYSYVLNKAISWRIFLLIYLVSTIEANSSLFSSTKIGVFYFSFNFSDYAAFIIEGEDGITLYYSLYCYNFYSHVMISAFFSC